MVIRNGDFMCSYHQTSSGIDIANRIFAWAATVMVITAGGTFKWTASPSKAIVSNLVNAAARVALRAGVVLVTN